MTRSEQETLTVSAVAHPFAVRRADHVVPAGLTVAEILERIQPDPVLRRHAHVCIDADYVPRELWRSVRPKPNATVSLRLVPMGGGGGKNPIATVLSIIVTAALPPLGPVLGTALSVGIQVAGNLALNALAPPGESRARPVKDSPTLFIQAARNEALPFGKIPRVLGRHRMVPPMGALPFTENAGGDQYLRMLFVWGYGPLNVSDLKIGETPLDEFDGVEVETRPGLQDDAPLTLFSETVIQNDLNVALNEEAGWQLRTTEADADEISVDVTLPRGLVKFSGGGGRRALTVAFEVQYAPAGTQDWSAGVESYTAVAAQETDALQSAGMSGGGAVAYRYNKSVSLVVIDRAAGAVGVIAGERRRGFDAAGNPAHWAGEPAAPRLPETKIAIARVTSLGDDPVFDLVDLREAAIDAGLFENAGDFVPVETAGKIQLAAGGLRMEALEITARTTSALRRSMRFAVPRGQYDVRMRRVTPDSADTNELDEAVWTALRTIRHETPVNKTGLAMTALRIRATDQLNGVLDRFNGVVDSIVPDWNGEDWTPRMTSNPAALYRQVLQGAGNARPLPDSRIDIALLERWHENCDAAMREFNAVIDYEASVRDVLAEIAAAGRASPSLVDGKWGVVEDMPQAAPVQHFTPRNTFGFSAEKAFSELPHALRVRFINRDSGWQQDERFAFAEGYDAGTATVYEAVDLPGVTDPEQAWRDGMYHLAAARLRPELYSFHADIEHIVCTRGDMVRFTHDVPLFGLASARVKSVQDDGGDPALATGVTLDGAVEMEAGKSYAVRFRLSDGSTLVRTIQAGAGTTQAVVFETPFDLSDAPDAGDLAMFGEAGSESVELVVKSVEPQGDMTARITCVDAAPEIHDAGAGNVPAFESSITTPPELRRPEAPVIREVQSGAETLIRNPDGSLTARIVASFDRPGLTRALELRCQLRAEGEAHFRQAETLPLGDGRISILDVTEGEVYDLRFYFVTTAGIMSKPVTIPNHRVTGATEPPDDVAALTVVVTGAEAHLSWDPVAAIDLSRYRLRHSSKLSGASWEAATDLVARIPSNATAATVPALRGTYLLKAVDAGGRESVNAASVVSGVAETDGMNRVATLKEHPAFAGAQDRSIVSEGVLRLAGADSIDDWLSIDAVEDFDLGESGFATYGVYEFADIHDFGAVFTVVLTAELDVAGDDINELIDTWVSVDDRHVWEGGASSEWKAELEVATTDDDPEGAPAWSAWRKFASGSYTGRAFKFRLVLQGDVPGVTPAVSELSVNIDMPDRVFGEEDIVTSPGGTQVNFAAPFYARPALAISARNMAGSEYYTITNDTAAGFTIRFFDAQGGGVSRSFGYVARGYGAAQ